MIVTVDKVAMMHGLHARVLLKKLAKRGIYPITSNYSLKLIDHRQVAEALERGRSRNKWLTTLGAITAFIIVIAAVKIII